MNKATLLLCLTNLAVIGLLPFVFFKKGRFNLKWCLTAAPYVLAGAFAVASYTGAILPFTGYHTSASEIAALIAVPFSVTSIALIFATMGAHRIPLALWHQQQDGPHHIVTYGPYRRIRHPFYASFLLALLAVFVFAPQLGTLSVLVYGFLILSFTASREERRLRNSEFGSQYEQYMRQAGRLAQIPGESGGSGMKEVFVDHLAFALGDDTRSVEEAERKGLTLSTAKDLREAGFTQHHVCRPQTTSYDLARRVVSNIKEHIQGTGAIVYSTCLPINGNIGDEKKFQETRDVKHLMDFPASHVQSDFGLDGAFVIGLNQQACTGVLGSLRLAQMLVQCEPEIERVLCVTSDRFPEGALYEQAYNLISDGAVACVVSGSKGAFRILACHGITNGAMAQASDDETVGSYFNYTHRVIKETLAKARLDMSDIDWVVPQNTNGKAWQILARLLRLNFERVYFPTLATVGHLISGDNIINLHALIEARGVKSGQRLLLFMAGYGLNWQCVILERT